MFPITINVKWALFWLNFPFCFQIAYWIHCFPELYFQKVKKDEMPARITYAVLYLTFITAAYLLKWVVSCPLSLSSFVLSTHTYIDDSFILVECYNINPSLPYLIVYDYVNVCGFVPGQCLSDTCSLYLVICFSFNRAALCMMVLHYVVELVFHASRLLYFSDKTDVANTGWVASSIIFISSLIFLSKLWNKHLSIAVKQRFISQGYLP